MLSAPQTVECLLRFWYPNSEASAQLAGSGRLALSAVSSSRAEHVDAYCRGSAFGVVKGFWSLASQESMDAHVAYANGILAWIDHQDGWINIYHVMSGRKSVLAPPDGETFGNISISASMLAAVTEAGICYILTMADDQLQTFQLASTAVQRIAASSDTVAILYHRSPSESVQAEMLIWSLHTQNTVECRAELHGMATGETSRHDRKIMIGARSDYLVLFERCNELRRFYFTRFGFDGGIQSQGSLEAFDTDEFSGHSGSSVPCDVNGYATVWSYSQYGETEKKSSGYLEIVQVQYDPRRDKLCFKRNRFRPSLQPTNMSNLFFWKSIAYCQPRRRANLRIFDLRNNLTRYPVTMNTTLDDGEDLAADRYHITPEILYNSFRGDENFLINVGMSGFLIWCFAPDIEMADEDEEYAQHRRKEIQERSNRRRRRDKKAIARVSREEEIRLDVTGNVGNYQELQRSRM